MGPLAGRTALVTGASRPTGIGAAVVRRLVADGAAVLVHSWVPYDVGQPWGGDPAAPQALVDELRAAGGRVEHVSADLADPDAPAALVARAHEALGGLDVLVANHARSTLQGLGDLTAAEIDLTYGVNVRATLLLVQALDRARRPAPGGRVVLFTSGQHAGAMPGELPYVASKGALHQLTASLAVPLVARGTTVNCVDPGPNDTGYADEGLRAAVAAQHPAGRWGRPEDTARLVAWLVSDEADWVTGQVIGSDGGWARRA